LSKRVELQEDEEICKKSKMYRRRRNRKRVRIDKLKGWKEIKTR